MRNPMSRAKPQPPPPYDDSQLVARVKALEAAVEESRQLSQRLADVVDVVTEVLVPAADRDDARMQDALKRLNQTLNNKP